MLRKNKSLSAFVAALLANAMAFQPVAAQTYDTWYAQGGYEEIAPYAYPYDDGAYGAPYEQDYYGGGPASNSNYYGGVPIPGTPEQEMARERAAQNWRSQYQTGTPAEVYPTQQNQDYYPQQDQAYYGQQDQGYYAQQDQGYYAQQNQGYYAQQSQGYYPQQGPEYYPPANQGYYAQDDYYSAADHYAYRRECERQRANNQVGGLVFGAIAGGLLGNAVAGRRDRGGATVAGAVIGGALGAGIASNIDCDDRYYVHQTYYDGFERGYSNRTYQWRNPNTGHHGAFRIGDYYQSPRGQRCATYAQTIWIQGRPEQARGYACRRPDGAWEIVG